MADMKCEKYIPFDPGHFYDVVRDLRKHGLSNGSSLGYHAGIMDEAADFIEAHLRLAQDGKLLYLRYAPGDTLYRICPQAKHVKYGDMRNGEVVKSLCQRCPWRNCDCLNIGYQRDDFNYIINSVVVENYTWYLQCLPYFDSVYFETEEAAREYLEELSATIEKFSKEKGK